MAVAKQHLVEAQQRMKKTADVRRWDHDIRVGDDVVIKSEFIHRGRFAHIPVKIRRRYVGPFQVVKQVSPVAFRVGLPESWKVHDTFHVSKLRKHERTKEFIRELELPPLEVGEEGEEEFEVEAIIKH